MDPYPKDAFKAAPRLAMLAMRLAASHMTVSQASSAVEHDAVATVLIIGASRGIGLEADPPPLKWSDLRYVFDIQEDCNGKEAIQA